MAKIKKTYAIVPDTSNKTYPVIWHIYTLWQTDKQGLLREFHSTYTSLDRAEDAVRERLIHAGHRADVSAVAAKQIADRALWKYMEMLDDADWVDGVLGDALDASEDDSR